jgi:serine/threonine protein phosphatase PrpC
MIQAIGMNKYFKKVKVVAASVAGLLHVNNKISCQDCYKYAFGKNLVAIVSDGAGSAKYGKIGAKVVCETLCDLLKNAKFEVIEKEIVHAVEIARKRLFNHRFNKTKNEKSLPSFAATIVGVVYYKKHGIFFHIGDGAALALCENADFVASRPENGNFSCETFFFTQEEWRENLRFTKIKDVRSILLMSDGLTSFAFNRDFKNIEEKFVYPINEYLFNEENGAKAKKALMNTLNMPKAQKLNSDDKTLVWIGAL